jgi:hypothetical protein
MKSASVATPDLGLFFRFLTYFPGAEPGHEARARSEKKIHDNKLRDSDVRRLQTQNKIAASDVNPSPVVFRSPMKISQREERQIRIRVCSP